MRALLQRVQSASVSVEGQKVGQIAQGLLIFLGVGQGDGEEKALRLAEKIVLLRIFEDREGKMNLSLQDIGGAALVVSQFTLYADTQRGRRPSFTAAAPPAIAAPLIERFAAHLSALGIPVQQGVFGADMQVELVNDGPVTLWLEQ